MNFYETKEWRELRYKALSCSDNKCMLCNSTEQPLHVDHIKPRSIFPEYELDINNLQILCKDCNLGKSNKYFDDFRPKHFIEKILEKRNDLKGLYKPQIDSIKKEVPKPKNKVPKKFKTILAKGGTLYIYHANRPSTKAHIMKNQKTLCKAYRNLQRSNLKITSDKPVDRVICKNCISKLDELNNAPEAQE